VTYQRYCEDLKRFNQPITLTEDEFDRKYNKPEVIPEKMVETRKKEPTLRLAIERPKALIKKPPRVYIPKEPKRKTDRVMTPKVSRAGMSTEEIKVHKAALARAWRAKRKEEGELGTRPRTDEDRENARVWYRNNQEEVKAKVKAYRQSITSTPEGKEASRLKMQQWRQDNPEKAREISKRSKAKQKEKRNATVSTSD